MADPRRGRFRAFLLTVLKNFLANERQKSQAKKRGGNQTILSLDFPAAETRFAAQPATNVTAEQLFDREWTISLLDDVVAALRDEYAEKGNQQVFEKLKGTISAGKEQLPYAQAARELGMSENAAQVAAHRLRKRYRELLRQEIAETLAQRGDIDDEIRSLISTLAVK